MPLPLGRSPLLRRHDPSKPANMSARDRQNEVAAILSRGLSRLRPSRPKNSKYLRKMGVSPSSKDRSM